MRTAFRKEMATRATRPALCHLLRDDRDGTVTLTVTFSIWSLSQVLLRDSNEDEETSRDSRSLTGGNWDTTGHVLRYLHDTVERVRS